MLVILAYCGLPAKIGRPKIVHLLFFWPQFLYPGKDPGLHISVILSFSKCTMKNFSGLSAHGFFDFYELVASG